MSARREIYKRKLTQGRVRDFAGGDEVRTTTPLVIAGVTYYEAVDGDLLRFSPSPPRGLVWAGARFVEKEIRR